MSAVLAQPPYLTDPEVDELCAGLTQSAAKYRFLQRELKLYHATTPRKAQRYRESGRIIAPVRGFDSLQAALAWACKVGRTVVIEFDAIAAHKLPDHHNVFGVAWWNDGDVTAWKCVFSAEKDA